MTTTFMLGLDGATFVLFDKFLKDGTMPFLGSMLQRGVHGDLMSTRNPLTPPAWTSMITGKDPRGHGFYDFLRPQYLEDGNVILKVNNFRDIKAETLWSIANRGGKRAATLNFVGHSPAPELDGYCLSGFVSWRHLRQGAHPPEFFEEVKAAREFNFRKLGMDIIEAKKCVNGVAEEDFADFIAEQREREDAWVQVTAKVLAEGKTDLVAVVIDGPDKMQHLFWRYLDPELRPEQPDDFWLETERMCLDYYRQLDRHIERLVKLAGPEANVVVTSDHGFGPTNEVVYINEWLAREGYLAWTGAAESDEDTNIAAKRMTKHLETVDWRNTVAFCPTPSSNAIYIKKEMGSGTGVSESAYLDTVLGLRDRLLAWRNPDDGGQVFTDVHLNTLEGRSFLEPCPDVGLTIRDGGFVSILKSNKVVQPRPRIEGTHRPRGLFIAAGPAFRQGAKVEPLEIVDMAPLLLTLEGLPVPEDLDGRVPQEALKPKVEVQKGGHTASVKSSSDDDEPTEEEREALLNQMRLLGYMD